MLIPENKTLVLFDGHCLLCSRTVQFILRHDKSKSFVFASLQSEPGKQIRTDFYIPEEIDSVIIIHRGKVSYYSESVFVIAKQLGRFWKLFLFFRIIPKKWADRVYRWIAGRRYRWFEKQTSCFLPAEEFTDRFL